MRAFTLFACLLGFSLIGCDEQSKPGATPGVEVKKTPDLDPRTDTDIDVTAPDVDVDVHRKPGALPDVDIDVTQPRDPDKKANQKPGSDPDPQK